MKVFRFMSNEEFRKYKNGEVLINDTKHIGRTNSVGFCFLDFEEYRPEDAFHFLSGIISPEICAVFEVEYGYLNKTWGEYAVVPNKTPNFLDMMELIINDLTSGIEKFKANEYCINKYSSEKFNLISYAEPLKEDYWSENWTWK